MANPSMPGEGKKILIVDDDQFITSIYQTKFESEGFAVVTALNGLEGIEVAKAQMPDLILLDILMPKLDGFEALARLKKDPQTKDIPVLMLTSLGQKTDVDRGLEAGAADYLLKTQTLPTDAAKKIRDVLGLK
jgi:CheY-like chemotaxis protein